MAIFRSRRVRWPGFHVSPRRFHRRGHEAAASRRSGRPCAVGTRRGHASFGRRRADSAVSLRAKARADRVHGTIDPTGPETRPDTVTLSHSPSAAIDDDAEAPASCRTIPSTAPASSPRASALAPALAVSSSRSWAIPAADPASSSARRRRTAGSATANSAVTAPRSCPGPRNDFTPGARRRTPCIMATPAPSGSGSAGNPGLHRFEG